MSADDREVATCSTKLWGVATMIGLCAGGTCAGGVGAVLEAGNHAIGDEDVVPGHATVIRVDPGTGEVIAVLPTGPDPLLLRVAAGHVWTLNFGDGTLTHVDPSTDTATTIEVGVVVAIESDGQDLWVARDGNVVARLDGASGEEEMSLRPSDEPLFALRDAGFIAVVGGSLWLTVPPPDARFTHQLWQIDPHSGDVLARVPLGPDPVPPFVAGEYLWVVTAGDQRLTRIDIDSLETVPVDVERFPWALAAGDGSMWIGHHVLSKVLRFDPDTLEVTADIALDADPRGLAFGGGRLWVATENALLSIDPASNAVTSIAEFGPFPTDTGLTSVAYLDGAVWVSIE
jgi:DNA-binding beta-propeller fold protein YncE